MWVNMKQSPRLNQMNVISKKAHLNEQTFDKIEKDFSQEVQK